MLSSILRTQPSFATASMGLLSRILGMLFTCRLPNGAWAGAGGERNEADSIFRRSFVAHYAIYIALSLVGTLQLCLLQPSSDLHRAGRPNLLREQALNALRRQTKDRAGFHHRHPRSHPDWQAPLQKAPENPSDFSGWGTGYGIAAALSMARLPATQSLFQLSLRDALSWQTLVALLSSVLCVGSLLRWKRGEADKWDRTGSSREECSATPGSSGSLSAPRRLCRCTSC